MAGDAALALAKLRHPAYTGGDCPGSLCRSASQICPRIEGNVRLNDEDDDGKKKCMGLEGCTVSHLGTEFWQAAQ